MKILIVPSWFRTPKHPNKGKFFAEQARALERAGHDVVVADAALFGRDEWSSTRLGVRLDRADGIPVYSCNLPSLFLGKFPLLYTLVYTLALRAVLRRIAADGFRADVIHAHSAYPAGCGLAVLSHGRRRPPLIVTEHLSTFNTDVRLSFSMSYILTRAAASACAFVCVSDDFRAKLEQHLSAAGPAISVIPNLIADIYRYHPRPDRRGEDPDFVFLSVGNLVPIKRMDALIEAFHMRFSGDRRTILRIAGEGRLRSRLELLIAELGLYNQVELLGSLDSRSLLQEYTNCDAFVLASASETFGVAFREAMAVGRPFVACRNGGVDGDAGPCGVLSEDASVPSLADAMLLLRKTIGSYSHEGISSYALQLYNGERVANELRRLYERSLSECESRLSAKPSSSTRPLRHRSRYLV
jgi:glycosyltransferase involved in cell wall biosynthesis